MAQLGWKQLLTADAWHRGRSKYPITAYSEFMPPPRLGRKPYGPLDSQMCHKRTIPSAGISPNTSRSSS